MNSIKKYSLSVLVLIITGAITLLLANYIAAKYIQFGIQQLAPTPRSVLLKEYPPNISTLVWPDRVYLEGTENLKPTKTKLRTDNDGFIIGEHDIHQTSYPVDIIFLGGSTTECLYVQESLRFPYLISQSIIQNKGHRPIRTLNSGVSGNHSLHSNILLLAKGLKYHPKFVVLMNNANDLSLLTKTGSYWISPPSKAIVQSGLPSERQSITFLRQVKDLLIPDLWTLYRMTFPQMQTHDDWSGFRLLDYSQTILHFNQLKSEYKSSLMTFIDMAKDWGIEPILMTQFNRIQLDDAFVKRQYEIHEKNLPYSTLVSMYDDFNQIIRETAKEKNILLIDLDREVPHDNRYIYDSVHLNDAGSQLVTKIISQSLLEKYPTLFKEKN